MNSHRKGIVAYLLIAFGLAWANWEILFRYGIGFDNPLFKILGMPSAFAPAIGTFVVRQWITREGFGDAGLKIDPSKWRYYVVAWLLPGVVVACLTVLIPLCGFGAADFTLMRGLKSPMLSRIPEQLAAHPWLLVMALPINALFATPILFGEEFGWRGYLQLRLFPARPVWGAIATGIIWGIWHYPVNLRGYNYPEHRIAGLVLFPIATVFLSIIFGWLRLKSGSIWCSSLAHASTNALGGSLLVLLFGISGNAIFTSYAGILGCVPLGALSAWIVFTGQLEAATIAPVSEELSHAAQAG